MITILLRKCALLLLLLSAGSINGFSMIVESGNTIVIDHSTTQDIYLAAGTVIINAPVHGQLVVAGGKIYINDSVYDDILLAGGTVVINGYVGGKIRCLGGTLKIDRDIQGDLVVAGGDISIEKNAVVSGNILASGGNMTLYGKVDGNIKAAVGKLLLYGTVGTDLDCRGGSIELYGKVMGQTVLAASNSLLIGSSAAFNGPVRYWAPSTADFGTTVKNGQVVRDESLAIKGNHWYFLGAAGLLTVLWYLATALLVIILLQYFFTKIFHRAGEKIYDSSLRSLGAGFLFFCGVPVLIFFSFISLIAIPIGLILLFGYIFSLLICGSFTAVVAANWFSTVMGSNARFWEEVWIAFGFFILLRLIFSIPFFGWMLFPLLVCIAFGAVLRGINWKRTAAGNKVAEGQTAILQKA
ncbi:hypothetical protein Q4E93_02885 [Flavitalea sp. BT771]|uniref:hypothetical protein n=1 Tax=Flavitalea sp. BT771 TaxID=3063329 RepID=UPI0026E44F2C|nr:hypothetical protein [Flavitalea sp. BT771]MDO6429518.1 hypothetical protein [Flavitalea sp. BT771]MDV6218354.1 hypothetical protein [Flavitalea sp. BT771]